MIKAWAEPAIALGTIGALLFTAYQVRENTRYQRLSVQPRLSLGFFHNAQGAGWTLTNTGLGPAEIHAFEVRVLGQPVGSWQRVAQAFGIPEQFHYVIPRPGDLIGQGDSERLFWVDQGEGAALLGQRSDRVDLTVCYCSLYDQCWIATNKGHPGLIAAPTSTDRCRPSEMVFDDAPQ